LYFSELYFIFYTFSKFIHISEILKPKFFSKKWEHYCADNLAQGISLVGKTVRLALAHGTTWARSQAVTAHCRHAVARAVRLVGGLLGDKIFTLTTREL
jgi:hypothetical protein